MKILYLSEEDQDHPRHPTPVFEKALRELGDLTLVYGQGPLAESEKLELIRSHDVYLCARVSLPLPQAIEEDFGKLKYFVSTVGSVAHLLTRKMIEKGLLVTNWGDTAAFGVAEGAVALLMAVLKDFRHQVDVIREGGYEIDLATHGGSLRGLRLGVYGCGAIGKRFVELVQVFEPKLFLYDPYLPAEQMPAGHTIVQSLPELFDASQAVAIHAGLSEQTQGSVTADLLARLPKYGVFINTARGGIVDQEALFRELASGRLRAGLDVLEPDELPKEHPARNYPNCLFTGHSIARSWPQEGKRPTTLRESEKLCLDNLSRYRKGQTLLHQIDTIRFDHMT